MYFEEYGDKENPVIVFLHGANFIHSFGKQYALSNKYYLLVPHIMGYGNEADHVFETEAATEELLKFIRAIKRKVYLVGFSLGAQLAVKLISENPQFFEKAIIVSPWLIKEEPELSKVMKINEKQLRSLKNPLLCNLIAIINGLPKSKRKEFVEHMQHVTYNTLTNMVNNNITLDTLPGFKDAALPMIALAGSKEQKSIIDSVKALEKINCHCKTEIWDKAAHNIPPVYSDRFNNLICDFFDTKIIG